jgi:hypothetical protein
VSADIPRRLAISRILQLGSQVGVPIILRADGRENAVSFSLRYDTNAYSNPVFLTGHSNAVVNTNFTQSSVIGVAMALPAGETFRAGYRLIGLVRFDLAPGFNSVQGGLEFAWVPVPITAATPGAALLPISASVQPQYVLTTSNAQLNAQSGLFEQKLVLSNPSATVMPNVNMVALDLGKDSLNNPITFYNAQGIRQSCPLNDCQVYVECECYCSFYDSFWGYCYEYWYCGDSDCTVTVTGTILSIPFAQINDLQPGESRTVTLEFYVTDHWTVPRPRYALYRDDPLLRLLPLGLAPVPITASRFTTNGVFLVEFPTRQSHTYYVQYSDTVEGLADSALVKTVLPAVGGTGSSVQWMDNGPPKTDSPPGAHSRFYRVLETQ